MDVKESLDFYENWFQLGNFCNNFTKIVLKAICIDIEQYILFHIVNYFYNIFKFKNFYVQ